MRTLLDYLKEVYPNEYLDISVSIQSLVYNAKQHLPSSERPKNTVQLIVYPDSLRKHDDVSFHVLDTFLKKDCDNVFKSLHILPFHPHYKEDYFSVINYDQMKEQYGTIEDYKELTSQYNVTIDGVFHHLSDESDWFVNQQSNVSGFDNFFLEKDPSFDYSRIYRPNDTPLFVTHHNKVFISTFENYNIDLNFANPQVLIEILKVVLYYATLGVKYIRLDQVAYYFKESGTDCFNLKADHIFVKTVNHILEAIHSDITLIVDPTTRLEYSKEYLKPNEARYIYLHALSPLVLLTFLKNDATVLSNYLSKLKYQKEYYYINYLGSPKTINLDTISNITDHTDKDILLSDAITSGAKIRYQDTINGVKPYDIYSSFLNLLLDDSISPNSNVSKILAAYSILLSLKGIPSVFMNELLGIKNHTSSFDYEAIHSTLAQKHTFESKVFHGLMKLIRIRHIDALFYNDANQKIIKVHPKLFIVKRYTKVKEETIIVNISNESVYCKRRLGGRDRLTKRLFVQNNPLKPFQVVWLSE